MVNMVVIKEPTRIIIISINILTITTTTTTRIMTVIIMVMVTAMAIMDGVPRIIYMIKLYTFIIEIMFVKINFKKKNLVLSDLN